jgi:DNA-binding MarR family transcriptional regulator
LTLLDIHCKVNIEKSMNNPMPKSAPTTRPTPQLPLDRRFSYRFNMIGRALAQHMLLHVDRELGLNLAEYRVLSILAERKSPSIKDIAVHTQLDKAHVTRALADLAVRGLVTQAVDKRDRRLRVVALTRAGQAMVTATLPMAIERQKRLERRLTAEELRVLWKALAVLSEEVEQMLAEAEQEGTRRRRALDVVEQSTARSGRRRRAVT